MVSPFFPTDDGKSRLASSSLRVEVLGMSWEGEEGRKQGNEEERERTAVGGSVGMKGGTREERKGKGRDGNERKDE